MTVEWKDRYPKSIKPSYDELLDFFKPQIRKLFIVFDAEMKKRFKVDNKYHKYTTTNGWTYGYGRNYNCELLTVAVKADSFSLLGVDVINELSLQKALTEAEKEYNNGYEEYCESVSAKRREGQKERAKKQAEREKIEMEKLAEGLDKDKFNKFKWPKKVARNDLLRLYQSDARGVLDEELLDDVGFGFYIRCKLAQDIENLIDSGYILCLHCSEKLKIPGKLSPGGSVIISSDGNLPMLCKCGYSYTYREYRRSRNAANMPGGRATPIFEEYIQKWPGCKTSAQKMMLIDWIIHKFHVTLMSGEEGRSVCINLIEGSLMQISDLINKLAYDRNDIK